MSDEIVRPNGKPYRPRKPPSVETFFTSSYEEGVVVLRTHDISAALELAADEISRRDLDPSNALTSWWRVVPFDLHHSGFDENWINDDERGMPCVVFTP